MSREIKEGKSWMKRFLQMFPNAKTVKTSRGGLNMPKRQPCPSCRANSVRGEKLTGGANYRCRTHGEFFVKGVNIS